jgi:hypothetical protein
MHFRDSSRGPGLAVYMVMRNLGLALLFASFALAPHVAEGKKARKQAKPRAMKAMKKPAKRAAQRGPVRLQDDELASAVVQHKKSEPTMTASTPAAAPVEANAPVNMQNQVIDDEVPGSKKK